MIKKRQKNDNRDTEISRRDFLKVAGTVAVGVGVGGCAMLSKPVLLKDGTAAYPTSEGYLLVDTKKCQGCVSCMLACSLVNEGVESLSLSRIQVIQNSFEAWPDDVTIEQCRQCVEPACVEACPEEALTIDQAHGNVRSINEEKCIGCMSCIEACPFSPSRSIWNAEKNLARKCDLCLSAQFWEYKGGPKGKQACVEICPIGAIKFTRDIPNQKGDKGYKVDLRDSNWGRLGYPTS
jgi:protein NrfC